MNFQSLFGKKNGVENINNVEVVVALSPEQQARLDTPLDQQEVGVWMAEISSVKGLALSDSYFAGKFTEVRAV